MFTNNHAYLNNKLAHLKNGREIRSELLQLAEDFGKNDLHKKPILYKDRMAQSLFNNDNLTYQEAKYFSNYENADFWVREYAKIRGLLNRERSSLGEIIGFTPRFTNWGIFFRLVGYFFCASLGLIPFIMVNKYIDLIEKYYENGMLVSIFLMIALPAILLWISYVCLKYAERCAACKMFLKDFQNNAFEVPPLIGPPENTQA